MFLFAFGLLVALPPAQAKWGGLCGPDGCPTAAAAIQSYVDAREGSRLKRTWWEGNTLWACLEYFVYLDCTWTDYTAPICPAGQEGSRNFENGCSGVEQASNGNSCNAGEDEEEQPPEGTATGGTNPVNLATGNKFQQVVDFETPGPNRLAFVRYYNSTSIYDTNMGSSWRNNYSQRLLSKFAGAHRWLVTADGKRRKYWNNGGVWEPLQNDTLITVETVGSGFEVTYTDDTVETYGGGGKLLSIRKRNGYEQTLAYDGNGDLASVTDSYGRALTFTSTDGLITAMTDPDGRTTKYVYGESDPALLLSIPDRLDEVIYPDDTPLDDADNPREQYLYEDPTFRYALTGIVDENGNRFATWAYDASLRAILSEHAGGAERVDIVYDDGANTRTTTNALGKQTVYSFQQIGGRNKLVQTDGLATPSCPATVGTNTYDSKGFLSSNTDREGNVTDYTYSSAGLLLSKTEAQGTAEERTVTYTWHPSFRVPTQVVEPGRTTDMSYDAEGRLTQRSVTDTTAHTIPYATKGEARTWTYTYTAEGLVATVDGPRTDVADVTTYTYDLLGNLTKVTNALGQETQMTAHNARGQPLTLVDANGIATDLAYDPRGRLVSRTVDPGAEQAVTSFAYDGVGQVTQVTLPDGSQLDYVYDAARRLVEVNNALGEKIVYTLDALGNRTKEEVKSSGGTILRTRSRVYDELGRLLRELGAGLQQTDYAYDLEDNLTVVIDPVGAATVHAYDALNRLVQTTDDLNGVTSYAYDARDNLTGVTDPRGLATDYTRNAFGEAIQLESPDTGITVYRYDSAGNLTRQQNARGAVTEYDYDALGRVTAKRFPGEPGQDVAYGYDDATAGRHGIGRLTSIADATGSSDFHYDARGNLTLEQRDLGGVTYDTDYAYDAADRLAEIVYPSGRIVTYQRDLLGRVSGVTTQADAGSPVETLASNIDYTAFGPMTGLDLGNGLATILSYDQDYRLSGLATGDGVTNVQDLTYGYDPASNITAITDNLAAGRSQAFLYDDLHRLTQGIGAYGQIDYAYDAVGNRTDRTVTQGANVTAESYTLDPFSNRLVSVDDGSTTRSLAHNAAGDIEGDDRGAGADLALSYDQAGRPAFTAVGGAATSNSLYNAKGERCVMAAGGVLEHSLYDREGRLIARFDAGAASALAAPTAIDLDNGDAGTSASGGWALATAAPGYLGADYAAHDGASELDSYSWTPSLPSAGRYAVYARWPRDYNRGAAADYTVSHDGGATQVSLDQKTGGGQWTLLGSFDMTPGLGQGVSLAGGVETPAAESEAVIDNTDPGTSATPGWANNTYAGGGAFWGANFQNADPGPTLETFAWPAAVPEVGRYKVYARWTADPNRATNAPYTVHHAGGATTVTANQEVNGGEWVLLGSFELDPLEDHRVELTNQANGRVAADALRFVRDAGAVAAGEEIVVDNTAAAKAGSWSLSTWQDGGRLWGANFHYRAAGGTGANTVTWTPALTTAGTYRVYTRWSAYSNRVADARYTVHHAGGATTVTADQRVNGGEWVALGSYALTPGQNHRVVLTDQGSGTWVTADAVRLVRESATAAGGEIVIDNLDPGAAGDSGWLVNTYTGGGRFWGTNVQQNDPGTPAEVFTWTPTLPAAQRYRVYARWTQDPNRATDAPYTVHHDGGATTVTVNQEQNGGIWTLLGTYAMTPGLNHRVELSDAANGRVIADAVKLVPDGNVRAVVADAVRFVPAETPAFAAVSSSLLDETIYLNGRPLARVDSGGALAYVHTDHLGTPQKMTDSDGAVVWDAVFRPFGAAESITGSASLDLRFPGQLYDAETALYYNYFRDYDPSLGRYVESDPIGLGGGVNTYGYAYSNPVRWIDPNGLTSLVIPRPLPMPFPRPFPYPVDPILPVPIPDEAVPDDDLVEYCTRLYVMCTQQGWGGDWSCFDCHFYCTGNNEEWPFEHCSPDNLACISENPNGTS